MSTTTNAPITGATLRQLDGEQFSLTAIMYGGEPCVLAKDIGQALGYGGEGSRLVSRITDEWSEFFIEGADCVRVEGLALGELKKQEPELTSSSTRHLLLLTEYGTNVVCMKSKKPMAPHLRRWLREDLFPSMRSGEVAPLSSAPARDASSLSVPCSNAPSGDQAMGLMILEERRMLMEERRMLAEERHRHAIEAYWAINSLINLNRKFLSPHVLEVLVVKAAQSVIGEGSEQLSFMDPESEIDAA